MGRKAGVLVGLMGGLSLFLTGCFDVEQSLVLNKDLSGTAGIHMGVNFEPMVLTMLRMQRQMAGAEGEPTVAEIAKAKEDFLASKKQDAPPSPEVQRSTIEKALPPGVKLLDVDIKDEGFKLAVRMSFAFDNVRKLQEIKLPDDLKAQKEKADGEAPKPAGKNPFANPFDGLQITDEGSTLLLTTQPNNPVSSTTDMLPPDTTPEMKKQIEEAFKGLHVVWKIETPFEVLESNATRREGKTLIWEYDLKTFEAMTPQQRAEGIRVKLKK
ncbi:MAG TPA: hypothetical protein VH988_30785 [Thermoanaerobaculia bacterium]|nr:hypothetical protein [Thermoanaerobaculia bacterium]